MRSGAFSDEPSPAADQHEGDVAGPEPTELRWRVSPGFAAMKCAVTVVLILAAVFLADDHRALTAIVVAAVVAGAYALRDVLAPVRLAADPEGLTVVTGYAGHRRLAWDEIERIRLESRTRAGLRSELLEIDTGDTLHLLSTYDLNARPADVADDLARIQSLSGRSA
ncbi:PH domain-containing protein [Dactylosporangium sp. NPDC051541]|uniref:PH domain-containing protein n=1 Tax=Dactylosporangium sp. NPDC051541 TaxID=3363977 RepID=UPI0037B96271